MGNSRTEISKTEYSGKTLEEIINNFIKYDAGSLLSKGFGVVAKRLKTHYPL